MGKKSVTQKQIAEELGLARITVSKTFNNPEMVKPETRLKVINKASEMGYRFSADISHLAPKVGARNDKCVLMIGNEDFFHNSFWVSVTQGLGEVLKENSVGLTLALVNEENEQKNQMPAEILNGRYDGVVLMGVYQSGYYRAVAKTGLPMVCMDITPELYNENRVCDILLADNVSGMYNIINTLTQKGYREFSFIGSINVTQSFHERWQGYCIALLNAGISVNPEAQAINGEKNDFYRIGFIEAALSSFCQKPEVVVCQNDVTAFITRQIKEQGHPLLTDETIIVGFDNMPEFTRNIKPLYTVENYPKKMGWAAADMILWRMENPGCIFRVVKTPVLPIFEPE